MAMTLPWARPRHKPTGEVLVMASSLTLASRRDIPAFLVAALRLRRVARQTEGFAGLGLIAAPGARTFYTLSAWVDDAALQRFVGQPIHLQVMRRFGPKLADSTFATWTADSDQADQYPPTWPEARSRLSAVGTTA